MNIKTRKIHQGTRYVVTARNGIFQHTGVSISKKRAFKQAISGVVGLMDIDKNLLH